MSEKTNEMNYAAELAAKIEEKNMELSEVSVVNIEAYGRFIKIYDLLKKLALLNDGGVSEVKMEHTDEKAWISIEIPGMDLYKDGLKLFCELLELADHIDVRVCGEDMVIFTASVNNLWEAKINE